MVTATSSSTASTPTSMPATAVPRSKFIPSTLLKQANAKRPQGPEEVEKAINDMDKLNGTSFKGWIRSEENISYLCTFKRTLFDEQWDSSPQSVIIALQWLTSEWSTPSISEFLLKMFYHWRLESTKFGTLLNGLVSGVMSDGGDKYNHEEEEEDDNEEGVRVIGTPWPKKKIYDLLHVLLIGESAQSTAKFLKSFTASETLNGNGGNQMRGLQFTKSWDAIEVNELVKKLALCLQWDAAFLRQMLMEFAGNVLVSPSLVSETQNQIRNLFQMKRAHSGEMGSGLSVNGSSSGSKGMKHSVSSPSLLKHATSSSSSSSSSSSTLNPSYIAAPRFSHLRPSSSGSNLPLANTSAAAAAAAHSTTARNSITTTTTTASSSTSNSARTSVASTARNSTSSKPSSSSTYATPMSQKSEVELFNMASDLVLSLDILDMIMLAREQEEIKGLMNEIAQLQMEQGDDVEEEEHHHRSTDEEFIKRIDSGYTL